MRFRHAGKLFGHGARFRRKRVAGVLNVPVFISETGELAQPRDDFGRFSQQGGVVLRFGNDIVEVGDEQREFLSCPCFKLPFRILPHFPGDDGCAAQSYEQEGDD